MGNLQFTDAQNQENTEKLYCILCAISLSYIARTAVSSITHCVTWPSCMRKKNDLKEDEE